MNKIKQAVSEFGMSLMKWGGQNGFIGSYSGAGAASYYFQQAFGDIFKGGECDLSDNSVVSICYGFTASKFVEARPTVQIRASGKGNNSEWEDDEANPLLATLNNNPSYTLSNLFASTVVDLMRGNAFWFAGRSASGKLLEWWWIPKDFVTVIPDPDFAGLPYAYRISVGSVQQVFPVQDVLHFKGFRLNPNNTLMGLDPLPPQIPHIRVDNACAKYVETILPNLGVPGALFTVKDPNRVMSNESAQELKRRYQASSTGDNRGQAIIVDAPYDVNFPNVNPDNMALDVIGSTAGIRVPAQFNLNPWALKLEASVESSTYNNMGEAERNAFDNGVAPYHRIIAEALTDLGVREFGFDKARVRFWFDYSMIPSLQEDKNELHKRVRADFVSGGIDRMTFKQKLGYEVDEAGDKGVYAPMMKGGPTGELPADAAPDATDPAAKGKPEKRSAPPVEFKALGPDSVLPGYDSDIVHDAIARATPEMQQLMLAKPRESAE